MDVYQHALLFCLENDLRFWDIREDSVEETHHYEKLNLQNTNRFGGSDGEAKNITNTLASLLQLIEFQWTVPHEITESFHSEKWFIKSELKAEKSLTPKHTPAKQVNTTPALEQLDPFRPQALGADPTEQHPQVSPSSASVIEFDLTHGLDADDELDDEGKTTKPIVVSNTSTF